MNENMRQEVCRSRSIDSMSTDHQTNEIHSSETATGSGGDYNNDKLPSTATFAKTFRTLRKRLSRTSNSIKHDQTHRTSHQQDNAIKSGGDDSEASSAGEDNTQLVFAGISPTHLDTQTTSTATIEIPTAVSLKVHRSLPAEKTPSIITSPPPPSSLQSCECNEQPFENDDNYDSCNLSKTWSSTTFTGAQLRGTCSLEYTEHMKEKSHKRKAHMIDLRKDDGQQPQQQLTLNPNLSTSKHSISTTFTSYHNHTLTLFNTKGALTY